MTTLRFASSLGCALAAACTLALAPHSAMADCSLTTTGNVPLPDLGAQIYKGYTGGLYPDGSNVRPAAHEAAGLAAAAQVQPLDSVGNPDPEGKIVLISVGMSNVTQEWNTDGPNAFLPRANDDPSKAADVTVVDGAVANVGAQSWADPDNPVYRLFRSRIKAANVTTSQVQVAWFECELEKPAASGNFPMSAKALQDYLEQILRNVKAICPNLRMVFMSSRDRAYTDDPATVGPEPWAYENGFAAKWTIADQINGTGNLNFDPAKGAVVAPYVTWGPYTWIDGLNPRSDGLIWLCSDLDKDDFVHPSVDGTKKVADQLLAFFKTDPTATPWFLKQKPAQPPQLTASTSPLTGVAGTEFHFTSSATSSGNPIVSYQWTFDDGTFSNAQNPVKSYLTAGDYTAHVTATDSVGNYATTSVHVDVAASGGGSDSPALLENVSTRGEVGTADNVLIGGFIINGTGNKKVLLRAIGPSLFSAGLFGFLADPTLELHDSTGATIGTNDNWQTTIRGGVITSDQVAAIQASTIPPTNAKESAIVATLAPGPYTAIVRGVANTSGVGLTEVYDLDPASSTQLANISTRGSVATADEVLIGGFIVGPGDPTGVLVRGLGPSFATQVSNALADPTLELRNSNGVLLQSDDNWADTQQSEIAATGLAPTNAKEAAILQVLAPGNYTATVAGKGGTIGVGLVEIYKLP